MSTTVSLSQWLGKTLHKPQCCFLACLLFCWIGNVLLINFSWSTDDVYSDQKNRGLSCCLCSEQVHVLCSLDLAPMCVSHARRYGSSTWACLWNWALHPHVVPFGKGLVCSFTYLYPDCFSSSLMFHSCAGVSAMEQLEMAPHVSACCCFSSGAAERVSVRQQRTRQNGPLLPNGTVVSWPPKLSARATKRRCWYLKT